MQTGSLQFLSIEPPGTDLQCAKRWLKIWHSDDDETIEELVAEAYSELERQTGRLLRPATIQLRLNQFPADNNPIVLPLSPLVSVSSVGYTDTSGTAATIMTAQVDVHAMPGTISPPAGDDWPDTNEDDTQAVAISYQAGAAPPEAQRNLLGCIKIMLDLAYHDNEPAKSKRLEARRDAIIFRWRIRDIRTAGITFN